MKSNSFFAFLTVCFLCFAAPANANNHAKVSPDEARVIALNILMGNPYGSSADEVAQNIIKQELTPHNICSPDKANWVFHVSVPPSKDHESGIKGYLVIDAQTGENICAGLPFLH